jgi:hypothetical protein
MFGNGNQSRSSEHRERSPRPVGSCHQCARPFHELPACRLEQVVPRQIGLRQHAMLSELVAEAKRTARW